MDYNQLWRDTLTALRLQMTQATYDQLLAGSVAVALSDDALTVQVVGQGARDMLAARLRSMVERTLSREAGHDLAVTFVAGQPAEMPAALPQPEPQPTPEPETEPASWLTFDHTVGGWAKHSHYVVKFWRAYLGAAPFDVWEFLRSLCKDASVTWTPVREIRLKEIATRTGFSPQRIGGVWRGCPAFDEALLERGEVIECCERWPATERTTTRATAAFPQGRPTCRHWVPGALEILAEEGLIVWHKTGTHSTNLMIRVQALYSLPLLVPNQVERLPRKLQTDHARWTHGLLNGQASAWRSSDLYSALAARQAELLAALEPDMADFGMGVLSASAHNSLFFPCALSANDEGLRAD